MVWQWWFSPRPWAFRRRVCDPHLIISARSRARMGSHVGVQTPVYHRGSDPEMVFSARTRARMGSDVGVQTPVPPPWVPVLGPCASPYMCPLGTHDIHLTRWRRSKRRSTPRIPSKQGRLIGRLMCFCMQLYPQSLDNERRRMMSRAWCAGPSVPEGVTSTGCANTVPTIRIAGI